MDQNTNSMTVKKNNPFGLTSFIVSLVGLLVAGIICGIVAIVFGGVGLKKFDENTQKNKWMALTGLIIGIVDIVGAILVLPIIYGMMGIL